ncbi:MAG: hypothetical protein CR968_03925 [Flavobacteriia bacterium]|nr:MAG: hypothetical protein CR968_03925 [Flavobacteriia bacterium]
MNFRSMFRFRKPTRFHYTPRFYKGIEDDNVYKFKSQYRKDEVGKNYNDYRGNWQEDRKAMRTRANYAVNLRLIIIIAILVFIALYIIDFDLSIFKLKR